jgi:hypothetical protein
MGVFSEYDMILKEVSDAMSDQPQETQIEYRLDCIVRELDEMCGLAANAETIDLIERNRIAVGQIKTRIDLIASFLLARSHKPGLRVVHNG